MSARFDGLVPSPVGRSGAASVWWLAPNVLLFSVPRALLIAVLPGIKTAFFSSATCDRQCASGQAAAVGGYLDSSSALVAFFISAALGSLSDVYGRKPFILLAGAAAAAPLGALWLWPHNLWPYFLLNAVSNALGGIYLWNAYLADVYPTSQRTVMFGVLRAVGAVSTIVSPLLGAYFWPNIVPQAAAPAPDGSGSDGSDSGSGEAKPDPAPTLFLLAFAVSVANLAYTLLLLPESKGTQQRQPVSHRSP
jgi:MFS family permease